MAPLCIADRWKGQDGFGLNVWAETLESRVKYKTSEAINLSVLGCIWDIGADRASVRRPDWHHQTTHTPAHIIYRNEFMNKLLLIFKVIDFILREKKGFSPSWGIQNRVNYIMKVGLNLYKSVFHVMSKQTRSLFAVVHVW